MNHIFCTMYQKIYIKASRNSRMLIRYNCISPTLCSHWLMQLGCNWQYNVPLLSTPFSFQLKTSNQYLFHLHRSNKLQYVLKITMNLLCIWYLHFAEYSPSCIFLQEDQQAKHDCSSLSTDTFQQYTRLSLTIYFNTQFPVYLFKATCSIW